MLLKFQLCYHRNKIYFNKIYYNSKQLFILHYYNMLQYSDREDKKPDWGIHIFYLKSQYVTILRFRCIFQQINAALMSIRDLFQKHLNTVIIQKLLTGSVKS